jgi:hypothetical protein
MKDEETISIEEKNFLREKKKVINENNPSPTRWPNKTIPYFYEDNFRNQSQFSDLFFA